MSNSISPPPPPPTFTPQQRSAALLLGGLLKKAVKVRLREAFDVWRQHSLVAAAEDDHRVRDELARMLEERRGAILAAVAEEERLEMEAERVGKWGVGVPPPYTPPSG